MKIAIFVLFAFVCMFAVSNAQRRRCDRICTQQIQPVCATRDNGRSYRRFNNRCYLAIENCRTNNAYRQVNLARCRR